MTDPRCVTLYLDFVSPYTWLALQAAPEFARQNGIRWDLRPVVYGALLDAHGLVGPAETDAKRRYTFHDVARCAAALGLPFVGPPAHPFRSLEALRALCLFRGGQAAVDLAVALSHAAWGEGRDLTDVGVLARIVRGAGLDAAALADRIAAPEIKEDLRRSTEEALAAGVFGVPMFALDGELFWGHDRMSQLAARLAGRLAATAAAAEAMLARPRGADRKGVPRPRP